MDRIKIYKPPDSPAQAAEFIEGLEPKLRDKLVRQIFYLSQTPLSELKEPHYKHFSIEKYQSLYELRERGRVVHQRGRHGLQGRQHRHHQDSLPQD